MEGKGRGCTYTPLGNLLDVKKAKPGKNVNVYGVICSPVLTDKKDPLYHSVEISDESIPTDKPNSTIKIGLFTCDALPVETIFRVGRILRIQKGVINSQNPDSVSILCHIPEAEPSNRKKALPTFVVFGEKTGAIVAASSEYYTISTNDNDRVKQLVEWNKIRPKDSSETKSSAKAATPEPKSRSKRAKSVSDQENPPAKKRKKIEFQSHKLTLYNLYPSLEPFACVVFVVDSTRVPLPGGNCYYDLIVWDGSDEPLSGELADDCSVPDWCANSTHGPFMHMKVTNASLFSIVEKKDQFILFDNLLALWDDRIGMEVKTVETETTVSSATVLDVDNPLVKKMLIKAECDLDDVHAFMEDLQNPPPEEQKSTSSSSSSSSKMQKRKRR